MGACDNGASCALARAAAAGRDEREATEHAVQPALRAPYNGVERSEAACTRPPQLQLAPRTACRALPRPTPGTLTTLPTALGLRLQLQTRTMQCVQRVNLQTRAPGARGCRVRAHFPRSSVGAAHAAARSAASGAALPLAAPPRGARLPRGGAVRASASAPRAAGRPRRATHEVLRVAEPTVLQMAFSSELIVATASLPIAFFGYEPLCDVLRIVLRGGAPSDDLVNFYVTVTGLLFGFIVSNTFYFLCVCVRCAARARWQLAWPAP